MKEHTKLHKKVQKESLGKFRKKNENFLKPGIHAYFMLFIPIFRSSFGKVQIFLNIIIEFYQNKL